MHRSAIRYIIVLALGAFAPACTSSANASGDAGAGDATRRPDANFDAPSGIDPCTGEDACVLAMDTTECCATCLGAYSTQEVAADSCLSVDARTVPAYCKPPACSTMACPAIACVMPTRAVCAAGRCTASMTCAPGSVHVQDPYGVINACHPACAKNTDCAIALHAQPCCPQSLCPTAWPADLVTLSACLIPPNDPIPAACGASPSCSSTGGPCPVATCPSTHAVCLETGVCAAAPEGQACPQGYSERGSQCAAGVDAGGG